MNLYAIGGIAIVVLVLLASLAGFVAVHDHNISVAQKAEDKAAIDAAQNNTAICKASNVSLQASIKPIADERDAQTAKVQELDMLWHQAGEIAMAWRGKYFATQTKLASGQQDAHAKGLRPTDPKQTCQQVMDEINADDAVWLPERDARMRDILGLPAAKPDALKVGK